MSEKSNNRHLNSGDVVKQYRPGKAGRGRRCSYEELCGPVCILLTSLCFCFPSVSQSVKREYKPQQTHRFSILNETVQEKVLSTVQGYIVSVQ